MTSPRMPIDPKDKDAYIEAMTHAIQAAQRRAVLWHLCAPLRAARNIWRWATGR